MSVAEAQGAGASSTPPTWVATLLGSSLVAVSPLRWGFRNESWLATLADGRRLAVTRLVDPRAARDLPSLLSWIQPRMISAGLPVPQFVQLSTPPPRGVIVTGFVDGVPGAELLESDSGAACVGSLAGRAWRKLRLVDLGDRRLPALWADPARLRAAAGAWLRRLAPELSPSDRARLSGRIRALPSLHAGRPAGLVHGDLVPANLLVHDGELVAVLDLEFARLADPLLDAGWFDWIVWFHHPSRHAAAWESFTAEAGFDRDDPTTRELLRSLPLVRLSEILAGLPRGAPARGHWLEHLRSSLARSGA